MREISVRHLHWMPLDIETLKRSRVWRRARGRPEIGFYCINLWTASWQSPIAGTLDDDDALLADLAQCDPGRWPEVRADVLDGWRREDGLMVHDFVQDIAEAALGRDQKLSAARRAANYRTRKRDASHGAVTASSDPRRSVSEKTAELVPARDEEAKHGAQEAENKDLSVVAQEECPGGIRDASQAGVTRHAIEGKKEGKKEEGDARASAFPVLRQTNNGKPEGAGVAAVRRVVESFCEALGRNALATPAEELQLARAIERHGETVLRDVIARARASPRLSGADGSWSGMPLKWLFDDERITQILRGDHDGKPADARRTPPRIADLVRDGRVRAASDESAGGAPTHPAFRG